MVVVTHDVRMVAGFDRVYHIAAAGFRPDPGINWSASPATGWSLGHRLLAAVSK